MLLYCRGDCTIIILGRPACGVSRGMDTPRIKGCLGADPKHFFFSLLKWFKMRFYTICGLK